MPMALDAALFRPLAAGPAGPVFLQGLALSLGLIVAIGAQNAFVLRQGLRGEHVLLTVSVSALCHALLIAVGVFGAAWTTSRLPGLEMVLRWGGALFLFGYALLSLRRALKPGSSLRAAQQGASSRGAALAQAEPDGAQPFQRPGHRCPARRQRQRNGERGKRAAECQRRQHQRFCGRREAFERQQRQRQVEEASTACAQAYHQGVFPHLGIGRGVGKAIDQQQIDHQQRKARRRGRRNDEELAPLHVVRPQHDEPPGQAHGQLAQASRHQCQWRR